MHKLIYFVKKIYVPLIFLALEIVAISLYATSSPYSQARMLSLSHRLTGWSSRVFTEVGGYMSLRKENVALTERIAELESYLNTYRTRYPEAIHTDVDLSPSLYIAGKVVSNTLNRTQNYLVINKGVDDNVRIGMSVLSADGYAVGYITNCSQNYSIATSILSTSFKISACLSQDRSMGIVYWSGDDVNILTMSDVSKYASFDIGDSVEALDFSEYFPKGTILGTVEGKEMNDDETMYICHLRLAADMSRLDNVILVDNRDVEQVQLLKKEPVSTFSAVDYEVTEVDEN